MGGHRPKGSSHMPVRDEVRRLRARVEQLDAENARLRDHVEGQVEHAETRIKDGIALGATVWRLALEDIVSEGRAAIQGPTND